MSEDGLVSKKTKVVVDYAIASERVPLSATFETWQKEAEQGHTFGVRVRKREQLLSELDLGGILG